MYSRLNKIHNWEELAGTAGYCATSLAARCRSSTRQLERYFLETRAMTPHAWLPSNEDAPGN